MNARVPRPDADFRPGTAEPLDFDANRITRHAGGFTIQLPSESPVPTPLIYRGKLYVSGGFSSQEYYCFDAKTAELIWAVQLDDDGPSSAVPFEDSILFGCESCTIFSLAAETGEASWSHWLGDPLLSMPAVANGNVFAVYPSSPEVATEEQPDEDPAMEQGDGANDLQLRPTHVAVCLDAKTGKVQWQQWIESDCMTAPVATSSMVFFTTLTGSVYGLDQATGQFQYAQMLRATSVPVVNGETLFVSRRADNGRSVEVAECLALHRTSTTSAQYLAARRDAPYLDQAVQVEAAYSVEADAFEASNGIGGGGFGGGFGGGSFGGGGHFSVVEEQLPPSGEEPDSPAKEQLAEPTDALGVTELQAADTIGLGNVSTLQTFQGSRVLLWGNRLFSCMGDRILCLDSATGEVLWSRSLEGNLTELGGHLGTPPIPAGRFLLLATVHGAILQLDPENGELRESYDAGSPIRFSPVMHEGRIYVGTQDGKVVCIETGDKEFTGWPVWGGDPGHTNHRPAAPW